MDLNEDKKKAILFGLVTFLIILMIVYTSILLVKEINSNVAPTKETYNTSAFVLETGKGYVIVDPVGDGTEVKIKTDDDYSVGDFVLINDDKIELINSAEELANNGVIVEANVETTTTVAETTLPTTTVTEKTTHVATTRTTSKSVVTTKATTQAPVVTTTTTVITTTKSEEELLSYMESEYNEVNTYSEELTFKEKAKNTFITFVDFIFYDGEIKGYKFNELTTKGKAKVIYYTLMLDGKIDEKWPNYKENLGEKYNDIKAKLLAKYMDFTTSICSERSEDCENTKTDFQIMKGSLKLTWDIVSKTFKYAYNKGTTYLKNWYEVFSGKV